MLDFKLNYYFEEFKDKSLPNRDEFRKNFKKKYGNFQYLEELIIMIERYQIKTYGETLPRNDVVDIPSKEKRHKENQKAWLRLKSRLGK